MAVCGKDETKTDLLFQRPMCTEGYGNAHGIHSTWKTKSYRLDAGDIMMEFYELSPEPCRVVRSV